MTIDEAIQFHRKQEEIQNRLYESEWINEKDKLHCLEYAEHDKQLVEWLTELKEAKRLLKAAVDDIAKTDSCFLCKYYDNPAESCQITDDCFVWRYADETEKLINS